jgi:AcrR family transcriptional regulator
MPRRKTFHHGDLRHALVTAALELLETQEPSALSLREVARHAGVTSGAPYHHFATRADLLLAVAVEGFAALGTALARAEAQGADPEDALYRRVLAYLKFAGEHLAHYRVMFDDSLREASSVADFEAVSRAGFAGLVEAVRRARPRLEDEALEALAFSVWALAHGVVGFVADGAAEALRGKRSTPKLFEATARHAVALVRAASA